MEKIRKLVYDNQSRSSLVISRSTGLVQVFLSDIIYIESSSFLISIHYIGKHPTEHFNLRFTDIENLLNPYHFFRINRNILINLRYFDKLSSGKKRMVYLTNGNEFRISYKRMVSFREYLGEHSQ